MGEEGGKGEGDLSLFSLVMMLVSAVDPSLPFSDYSLYQERFRLVFSGIGEISPICNDFISHLLPYRHPGINKVTLNSLLSDFSSFRNSIYKRSNIFHFKLFREFLSFEQNHVHLPSVYLLTD